MNGATFRCTAYETPKHKGGMYGEKVEIDSEAGLVLDEFVLDKVVHIEEMSDGYYFARVGEKTLALFAALDRERPGWREETCATSGDEVCRAWYELEKSLALGPDGEGKEGERG